LLLQTDKETANSIALRMKGSVQQLGGTATGKVAVNVSLAVVAAPEDGNRIDTLVDAARRRLSPRSKNSPPAPPRFIKHGFDRRLRTGTDLSSSVGSPDNIRRALVRSLRASKKRQPRISRKGVVRRNGAAAPERRQASCPNLNTALRIYE
jgi:hypothetical protein